MLKEQLVTTSASIISTTLTAHPPVSSLARYINMESIPLSLLNSDDDSHSPSSSLELTVQFLYHHIIMIMRTRMAPNTAARPPIIVYESQKECLNGYFLDFP